MKRIITGVLLLCVIQITQASDLENNSIYRLEKSVHNLVRSRDGTPGFVAARDSKFKVIDNSSDPNSYIVRFIAVYDSYGLTSTARIDEEYKLARNIGGTPVANSAQLSLTGPVSGPLIVPFKYRTDDKSLSGEATIGYYAGYRTEMRMPFTDTTVPFSPFIAGGLTQINVSTTGDADNKSGVTLAVGILINNWANVNIGFVYGQDRIGDSTWKHEGDGWVSFMIGWDI